MVTSAAPEPTAPHSSGELGEPSDVVALYRRVATVRLVDERLAELHREGRVPAHRAARGREAATIGAASALRARDVVFGGDFAAAIARGMSLASYAHHLFADAHAPAKGREPPERISSRAARIASPGGALGAHIAHAVGFAWAAKTRGEDAVALALFDDAATNAADFHAALNFAGVFGAPAILFCRRDESSQPVAGKAVAYGVASITVDGGDVFAVADAVRRAIGTPVLVDAIVARDGDPIARARRAIEARGLWSDAMEAELRDAALRELDAAIADAEAAPTPARATLFEDVYAGLPNHLREQRER